MENPNKTRNIIISILTILIILIVIGVLVLGGESDNTSINNQGQTGEALQDAEDEIDGLINEPTQTEPSQAQQNSNLDPIVPPSAVEGTTSDTAVVAPRATYTVYSQAKFDQARNQDKNVVLFFHASWCPTCRALDTEIKNGLNRIPNNTEILKIDYDQYSDLKREYNVRYQHTLVFIKGNNPPPYSTLQGLGIDEIISQINSIA